MTGDRVEQSAYGPNLAPLTNEAFRRVHAQALEVARLEIGTTNSRDAIERLRDVLIEAGHSRGEVGR